jgi:hypothetical protein
MVLDLGTHRNINVARLQWLLIVLGRAARGRVSADRFHNVKSDHHSKRRRILVGVGLSQSVAVQDPQLRRRDAAVYDLPAIYFVIKS